MRTELQTELVHENSLVFIDEKSITDSYVWDPWIKRPLTTRTQIISNQEFDQDVNLQLNTDQAPFIQISFARSYLVAPFVAQSLILLASLLALLSAVRSFFQLSIDNVKHAVQLAIHIPLLIGQFMYTIAFLLLLVFSLTLRPKVVCDERTQQQHLQSTNMHNLQEEITELHTLDNQGLEHFHRQGNTDGPQQHDFEREEEEEEGNNIPVARFSPQSHIEMHALGVFMEVDQERNDSDPSNTQSNESSSPHSQDNNSGVEQHEPGVQLEIVSQIPHLSTLEIEQISEEQVGPSAIQRLRQRWVFDIFGSCMTLVGCIGFDVTIVNAAVHDLQYEDHTLQQWTFWPLLLGSLSFIVGNAFLYLTRGKHKETQIPCFSTFWFTKAMFLLGSLCFPIGIIISIYVDQQFNNINYQQIAEAMIAGYLCFFIASLLAVVGVLRGNIFRRQLLV